MWSFDFELGWHRSISSELRRNCFVKLFSLGNILRQRQHSNGIIGTYGYQMENRWSLFSTVERRWKVRSFKTISWTFNDLFSIRYYECTIDDVLDDGTCTIVYDGFESAPLTVVRVCIGLSHSTLDSRLLLLGLEIETIRSNQSRYEWNSISSESSENKVRTIDCLWSMLFLFLFCSSRRELEQRLRELKRRKKDKKVAKLKEFEEEREKDKKRWTDFNSKVRTNQLGRSVHRRTNIFSSS